MKTGFAAVKLAIAGFIVPFMFVYSPQLLLIDTGFLEGVRVAIGACFGVFMIGVAVEGYLFTNVNIFVRLIAVGGALALIDSGITTDLIGLAVLIVIVSWQHFVAKKARQVQPAKAGG